MVDASGLFWMAAGTAVAVPAGLVLVAGRYRAAALGAWFASPVLVYLGVVGWEMLTRPGSGGRPGAVLYGLALVTPVVAPVWGAAFLTGLVVGAGLRALGRLAGLGRRAGRMQRAGEGGVA